ncbi:MAG: hypothetical protein AAB445_01030 [Patescibacteria group bacterium]
MRNGIETGPSQEEMEATIEQPSQPEVKDVKPPLHESIQSVETARGSTYTYLPDGRTQRFKKVEGKEYEPQDALVYVPDFAWVPANAPKESIHMFGENETQYDQLLLSYAQGKGKKVHIVDAKGRILKTNEDIAALDGRLFIACGEGGKADFLIPVSREPIIGWSTYDTRIYTQDEKQMQEQHLGNKVIRIVKK